MASYQKRGKTWQYTISRMINGKSRPIRKGGFRTKAEAVAEATEIESKLNKGINVHLKPEPFNDYFKDWYELYKIKIEDATLYHYEYSHKAIDDYFGSTPIQNIERRDYQKFINKFGDGKAKETVSKLNSHIRGCIQDAMEEGVIHKDFTRKVVIYYTIEAKRKEEKHLNYKESKKLIDRVTEKLNDGLSYYMILLAVTSGLRYAELIGLTRNDFNFKSNEITVNKTWGYNTRMPKGFGPTKNESSNRVVKVSKKVMLIFKELFQKTPTNIHQLVFYSGASKYQVISNSTVNKSLRKVLDDLGIDVITLHGLRHTFASVLLYKRISLGYVSDQLGHKDTITTQKDYAHVLSELKQEDGEKSVNVFDEMVS